MTEKKETNQSLEGSGNKDEVTVPFLKTESGDFSRILSVYSLRYSTYKCRF